MNSGEVVFVVFGCCFCFLPSSLANASNAKRSTVHSHPNSTNFCLRNFQRACFSCKAHVFFFGSAALVSLHECHNWPILTSFELNPHPYASRIPRRRMPKFWQRGATEKTADPEQPQGPHSCCLCRATPHQQPQQRNRAN